MNNLFQGFIKKKGYPNTTAVTRVVDGGEPVEFRALFNSWRDPEDVSGMGKTHAVGKVGVCSYTYVQCAFLLSFRLYFVLPVCFDY